MGNINCCKKPDEPAKNDEIINDEEINQLDNEGFPQDSVQNKEDQNKDNTEEIKPLPNNEEIEVNASQNKEEPEQNAQNEEEQNIEEAANNLYEQGKAAISNSQNQNVEENNEENQEQNQQENEQENEQQGEEQEIEQEAEQQGEEQEQEVEQQGEEQEQENEQKGELQEADEQGEEQQQKEEQQESIAQQQEVIEQPKQNLVQEKIAQREIIEYQLNQEHEGENEVNKQYNDIIGATVKEETQYVKDYNQYDTNNVQNTNNIINIEQQPAINYTNITSTNPTVFKDSDDLNKYFQNLGIDINTQSQVLSQTDNNFNINTNYNYNTNINTNETEEDLNKYFEPNAYTQNGKIDLASLGLQASTTVQGATNADEINKYFQNIDTTYNTGNVDLAQYGYSGSNSATENVNYSEYSVTKNTGNHNNYNLGSNVQYNTYSQSQIVQNAATTYAPQTASYSYSYSYNTSS